MTRNANTEDFIQTRRVLKRPGFPLLLAAEIVSGTGSMMTALALPWFVLQTTGSPSRASAVLAVEIAPVLILGIPSGTVAARLGAKKTLLLTQVLAAPLIALIPLLHHADLLTFPVLLVLVFLTGTLWTPFYAAQATIIPELLGEDEHVVGEGNAILQGATRSTYWLGPLAAGFLIAAFDAPVVLLIDAATFLAGFVLLIGVRAPGASVATEDINDILGGVRFIARTPLLRSITVAQVLSQASYQSLVLALPVLAFVRFEQNARVAGLLDGAWGAGAFIGTLVAIPLVARGDPLVLASAGWIAQALPLWLLVARVPVPLLVVLLLASGLANGIRNPPTATLAILRVPASLRPQAASAAAAAGMLGGLVMLAATGPSLEHLGVSPTFVGIATASSLGAALFVAAARRERQGQQARREGR
ncbi:MAG: MFS transporter [Actinomycetota bacterium]|nr:MFS transporter [Actinomycetota bacterium]